MRKPKTTTASERCLKELCAYVTEKYITKPKPSPAKKAKARSQAK